MKKISKRIQILKTQLKFLHYSYLDAIKLLKTMANAKFIESLEAHISLNIDPKQANQQVRSTLMLPHGTINKKKIAVFTENISEALNLGADIAGIDEILSQISKQNFQFDILITTPQYMPKLLSYSKILGPKGLMPSLKSGTLTSDLKLTLSEFNLGKIEYRADKGGVVHLIFGKSNDSDNKLSDNLLSIYSSIEKNRPLVVKGKFFKSFYICSTMSPSICIDLSSFK